MASPQNDQMCMANVKEEYCIYITEKYDGDTKTKQKQTKQNKKQTQIRLRQEMLQIQKIMIHKDRKDPSPLHPTLAVCLTHLYETSYK